jgi:hypothetical protein
VAPLGIRIVPESVRRCRQLQSTDFMRTELQFHCNKVLYISMFQPPGNQVRRNNEIDVGMLGCSRHKTLGLKLKEGNGRNRGAEFPSAGYSPSRISDPLPHGESIKRSIAFLSKDLSPKLSNYLCIYCLRRR